VRAQNDKDLLNAVSQLDCLRQPIRKHEPMSQYEAGAPSLKRTLGVWALTAYGVGDILGAGIYALVGQVAGKAGGQIWISFVVAMFTATLTGLTYAELVTRFPHSGGVATFCLKAFGRPRLAFFAGWLVLCSGVVSMSTVTRGFTNYFVAFFPEATLPHWPFWLAFLSFVAALNFWGLRQSSATNIVFTLIEASGLVLVMTVGIWYLIENGPAPAAAVAPVAADQVPLFGILSGAVLAFFAFIGFEDMVNIAEEVEAPERIYPRAIMTAIGLCGAVYITVSLIAFYVVPFEMLTKPDGRPLLDVVVIAAPAIPPMLFTAVALVAVSNTGLLNAIMASRLI
jgi:amino acid transporter